MEDRLFELGKKSKKIFTRVSDDYCLVTKKMPIDDQHLEDYINGMRQARATGINIAEVIDYQMIPETVSFYDEGRVSYTKGVFLERMAKGTSNGYSSTYINTKHDEDITDAVNSYVTNLNEYVKTLDERANMSQKKYSKFVKDCIGLQDFGLIIDPKPSNFFIDPLEGVTIIDPIPLNNIERLEDNEYFPRYISLAFLGYGRPKLYINGNDYSVVTPEVKAKLINAYAQIDSKVSVALRQAGISAEVVRKNLSQDYDKYTFRKVSRGDIMSYLIDAFISEMEKEATKDNSEPSVETKDGNQVITINV